MRFRIGSKTESISEDRGTSMIIEINLDKFVEFKALDL